MRETWKYRQSRRAGQGETRRGGEVERGYGEGQREIETKSRRRRDRQRKVVHERMRGAH